MATSINRDSQQCRQLPQLPSDNEIIDACDRNPPCDENGDAIRGLMYPPQAPIFWIKYGLRSEGRDAEAQTHDFAFRALERIPQSEREGIRIPEVYRIFTDDYPSGQSMVYIVMEYVPGKTLLQILRDPPNQRLEHLYDHIAKAIRLFLSFEVPHDATPGPYGGGLIRHPLFKDYEANIEYSSVAQLQHHINKVRPIQFRV
jgi:serine/threonine protein kinase